MSNEVIKQIATFVTSTSIMITELKQAFDKAEQLSSDEQKMIAGIINEELQWNKAFSNSSKELDWLANEALEEYNSGKTKQTDW